MDLKKVPQYDSQNQRRYKYVKRFLDKFQPKGKLLDIGGANVLGMKLARDFNLEYETTNEDLDYTVDANGKYDTIFIFEVLEHLMNPLLCLNNVKKYCKENTQIFISVPRQQHLFWNQYHFHEFDKKRFEYLIEKAGLKIIGSSSFIARFDWLFYITGIRPILRLLFFKPKHFLHKCVI